MWPDIFTGTRGRRLIYAFAVCVIAVSLGSLVPGPTWKKWTGWDPLTAKTTSADEAIYRLERVQREMADADRAAELERITKKITRREALTAAEERFIVEVKHPQSNEKPPVSKPQAAMKAPVIECTKAHHCILREQDDGSTERVSVPKGKTLCLDGSSWDNRDKLGLRSTYQGGPEVVHTCTRGQVMSGTCREPNLDSFRFVPKEEVRIPRYWFVPEGNEC
jgi:hypothetical protein